MSLRNNFLHNKMEIPKTLDSKASIETAFLNLSIQFVESCVAAWPEDPLLPIAASQIKALTGAQAISLFENEAKNYLDGLSRRNEAALFELGRSTNLAALAIEDKYKGANINTRDTIWTYLNHLSRFVSMYRLYSQIPSELLNAVNEAASGLKESIEKGSADMNSLNPFELGQSVMNKFTPEALDNIMKQMIGNPDSMTSLLNNMSGLVGSQAPALSAAIDTLKNPNGPDVNVLADALASVSGPAGTGGFDMMSLLKFMPK